MSGSLYGSSAAFDTTNNASVPMRPDRTTEPGFPTAAITHLNGSGFFGSDTIRNVSGVLATAIAGAPSRCMSVPTTSTSAAPDPPSLRIFRSCASDTVLPSVRRISVTARSSETSTDCTPGSFRTATRSAWAQVAQSIPSVLRSTFRSSANANDGVNRKAVRGVLADAAQARATVIPTPSARGGTAATSIRSRT